MARDPVVKGADTMNASPDKEPWVDLVQQLNLDFASFYLMSEDDLRVRHQH